MPAVTLGHSRSKGSARGPGGTREGAGGGGERKRVHGIKQFRILWAKEKVFRKVGKDAERVTQKALRIIPSLQQGGGGRWPGREQAQGESLKL